MGKEDVVGFLRNKKFQWAATIILLLIVVTIGTSVRLQVLPNLIDDTTGDYTPLALDPYYFLRISETINDQGGLPAVDGMRYQAAQASWSTEILPQSTVFIYKIFNIISPESSLRFVNVISPVVFFVLGLAVFFFLILLLTKNKPVALASAAILAVIPPYLYRTLAGFSDHESIGMFGFFLALLTFLYGILYLDKKKPKNLVSGLLGLVSGFCTMFAIASWGGGAKFLFMILPLAFIATWLVKKRDHVLPSILFYLFWILGTLLAAPMFGFKVSYVVTVFMLNSAGVLSLPVLGYIIINSALNHSKLLGRKFSAYSEIISVGIMAALGITLYSVFIGNAFTLIFDLIGKIINPFGTGRVGLTVAENKQPYLNDWIGQISKTFFYTMLAGCFFIGVKIAGGIKKRKLRPLFIVTFSAFIFAILFSRISASSILNGDNFISGALFFVSFLAFAVSTLYIYIKSEWDVDTKWIFIAAWMIPMLLAVRSAIRVFFAIVPFVSFMVPFLLLELSTIAGKSKDSIIKILSWSIFVVLIVSVTFTSFGFYESVKYQAENQRPSYNTDWQNAMSWVRGNTTEGSVFLHWWDYGYWVQTGGAASGSY